MKVPQINITLDGNMREVIVNPGVTRPPRLEPPLTNDVRTTFRSGRFTDEGWCLRVRTRNSDT